MSMTEAEILTELRKMAAVPSVQAAALLGMLENASPERKPALIQQAEVFLTDQKRTTTVGPTEYKIGDWVGYE